MQVMQTALSAGGRVCRYLWDSLSGLLGTDPRHAQPEAGDGTCKPPRPHAFGSLSQKARGDGRVAG